jgi:hypothetical protein
MRAKCREGWALNMTGVLASGLSCDGMPQGQQNGPFCDPNAVAPQH